MKHLYWIAFGLGVIVVLGGMAGVQWAVIAAIPGGALLVAIGAVLIVRREHLGVLPEGYAATPWFAGGLFVGVGVIWMALGISALGT